MRPKTMLTYMLFLTGALSCKKVLDTQPEFTINGANSFRTISDFEYNLTGAYRLFRSTSYYGSTDGASNAFGLLPDMLADNLDETSESLGNGTVLTAWNYASDEKQIEDTWVIAYRIISQANLIQTKGIDKFAASNQGAVNRIKGQALAMRALVHFDVLRYWAEEYDRNSTKPGIPYITEFNYEVKPSRGTVKQTYDHIEKDLKDAKVMMANTDKPINAGGRAYIDSSAVNAMLARMYLYANQLDSAIKYATYAINSRGLASRTDFPNTWIDASVTEVFWSLVFESGEGGPGTNAFAPDVNRNQYRPNPTLVATYDQANDIRFASYFQSVARKNNGAVRRVLSKYNAKSAQPINPDGVTNFKVFRTGEMYLIRAEAYARKGNNTAGSADLNTLRSARIAGYVSVSLTGNALLDAIELERRKELIGEGHRFFDLKRTRHVVSRTDCSSSCTLPLADRAWTWPIPQGEIDANPSILPQNPGY